MDQIGEALNALLRPDQRAILSHPAKRKYVCNGRRWGKTLMGSMVVTRAAMMGLPCAWVAPTYKNSRPLWRQALRLASVLKGAGEDVKVNQTDKIIEFPSRGGWFAVYSGDSPDSILGESFGYVVLDEAARLPERMVTDAIEPTLADLDGTLLGLTTPKGMNWYHSAWHAAQADTTGYSAAFTAPTSDNPLPNIQRAFKLAGERLPELTFRQEWLAEFLSHSGAVFRMIDRAATGTPINIGIPGRQYVMGVDLARVTDYTVCVVLDVTDEYPVEVFLDRWQGIDWPIQISRIVSIARAFNPSMIAADKTGLGNMPVSELQDALPDMTVWGISFNTGNKTAMVHQLSAALERGEITLLDDPIHKGELKAYHGRERASGTVEYSAPAGMHDDTVSALMLALEAGTTTGATFMNLAA